MSVMDDLATKNPCDTCGARHSNGENTLCHKTITMDNGELAQLYADVASLRAKLAEAEKREQGALSSLYVALADKDAAEKRLADAEEREKKLKREIGIRRWMAASGEGYDQAVTDWDGADQGFRDDYLAGLA